MEGLLARAPGQTATDVTENGVSEKYESQQWKVRLKAVQAQGSEKARIFRSEGLRILGRYVLCPENYDFRNLAYTKHN